MRFIHPKARVCSTQAQYGNYLPEDLYNVIQYRDAYTGACNISVLKTIENKVKHKRVLITYL